MRKRKEIIISAKCKGVREDYVPPMKFKTDSVDEALKQYREALEYDYAIEISNYNFNHIYNNILIGRTPAMTEEKEEVKLCISIKRI